MLALSGETTIPQYTQELSSAVIREYRVKPHLGNCGRGGTKASVLSATSINSEVVPDQQCTSH